MFENKSDSEPDSGVESLARDFARGVPQAVQSVRQRVRKILFFKRYGMTDEELRDLEQEIMTQLWQAVNRSGFDPSRGFWGFVEVVTARRCIDWLRSPRRETALDGLAEIAEVRPGPVATALDRERLRLAERALAQLEPSCRELLHAHFIERRSYRELAERTGKTEGALRVQLHRCVRATKNLVEHLQRDPGR